MLKVEGRNPVIEALRSKRYIKKILIEQPQGAKPGKKGSKGGKKTRVDEYDGKLAEIVKRARNRQIKIEEVGRKKLKAISETGNHQGVIAFVNFEYEDFGSLISETARHNQPNNYVFIRDAMIESNVGAIARSVEAAGFRGVCIPPKLNITPQMVRSSMGALLNLKVSQLSPFAAMKVAKAQGLRVIGVEVTTDTLYTDANLSGDTLLIVGGEDHPLSEPVLDRCDQVVKIPLHGKINSLNMSVAAAVVIFEKLRQDGKKGQ